MTLAGRILREVRTTLERRRLEQWWHLLRHRGLQLGEDVWLPRSTWIDPDYSFLISIGEHCGFGEECLILAHDAQMDEFLDGTRIARVVIRQSCHIGARTTILPGVEIGPRTIVGANSVVSKSLPPETICAGNPARVLYPLARYLEKHRARMQSRPTVAYQDLLDVSIGDRLRRLTETGDVYVTGGRSAELRGEGGTPRTAVPHARV